jgi:hypothetical protein
MPDELMLQYGNSPIPAKKSGAPAGERNPDRAIRTDERGQMNYDSAASTGHVSVMAPSLPGSPRETETLHVRDLGQHIIGRIESSMNRQGYITSGAQQSPATVFSHYIGVVKGLALLDAATIRRMEGLAREFHEAGEDEREFFQMVVKPYLGALTPKRRQS